MKFDGHLIDNGYKIATTSNYTIYKHRFEPSKIDFPDTTCYKLKPVSLEAVRNYNEFCNKHNFGIELF